MSTSYLSTLVTGLGLLTGVSLMFLAGGNWFSQGLIGLKVNLIIRKTPDGQTRRVKSSQVD